MAFKLYFASWLQNGLGVLKHRLPAGETPHLTRHTVISLKKKELRNINVHYDVPLLILLV